ncbi:hypothetical protein JTB14_002188 [Gonioctena quinquepunctata]|nr:hypothetical protein JTB14_002188 [Gonioctena quinquepunctata]
MYTIGPKYDLIEVFGSNINWLPDSHDLNSFITSNATDTMSEYLINSSSLLQLKQNNNKINVNSRILDLPMSPKIEILVTHCNYPLVNEDSHHKSLEAVFKLSTKKLLSDNNYRKLLYKKADYDRIYTFLDINWTNIPNKTDIELSVQKFYNVLKLRSLFLIGLQREPSG